MSNDRLKFSFMWQHQETGAWMDKRYSFDEVLNGQPYDDFSDSPLLRRYHHVATRQWTGLYDSEGREIYEEDLLHHPAFAHPIRVTWGDNSAGFQSCGTVSEWQKCKVIGNKYEDREDWDSSNG